MLRDEDLVLWKHGTKGVALCRWLIDMAQAIRDGFLRREDAKNHDCTCPASWGEDYCNCVGMPLGSDYVG